MVAVTVFSFLNLYRCQHGRSSLAVGLYVVEENRPFWHVDSKAHIRYNGIAREGRRANTNAQAVAPTSPKGGEDHANYIPYWKVYRHDYRVRAQKKQPPLCQVTDALGKTKDS